MASPYFSTSLRKKKKQHAHTLVNFLKSWLCPNFSCCPCKCDRAARVDEVAKGKNRNRNAVQYKHS